MNIAICDDNTVSVDYLSSLCEKITLIHSIIPYTSPETLLSDIKAGVIFDVILMDIDYESEKNGIDYAEEIYHTNPLIRTIYITGYTERYVQYVFLKKSSLVGFISKPAQTNILAELLIKAQNEIDSDKHFLVCATGKGASCTIPCRSILYLESNGHKVLIHAESGPQPYTVYDRLVSFLHRLPSNFKQCHKSYIINMEKIKKIEKNTLYLIDDTVIQISKAYATKLKRSYIDYMQKKL